MCLSILDILSYSYLRIRRHIPRGVAVHYDTWATFLQSRSDQINLIEGFKKTHFNPPKNSQNKLVWLFGGSTMEGSGYPDTTIPSYLASLCSDQYPYFFVNLAKSAMVNDQEVRLLLLLLKNNDIQPNLVIFYDGVNDLVNNVLYREVNAHYEMNRIKSVIEYRGWQLPIIRPFYFLWENSYAKQVFLSAYKNFIGMKKYKSLYEEILSASAIEYKKRADFIDRIGNELGFKAIFVLQPFLLEENEPRIKSERKIWEFRMSEFRELTRYFYAQIREEMIGKNNFIDLSSALYSRKKQYYKDTCHLTDEGRYEVAKKLSMELKARGYLSR
jgi:hypothetical protein